jgi:hypothetical protein
VLAVRAGGPGTGTAQSGTRCEGMAVRS